MSTFRNIIARRRPSTAARPPIATAAEEPQATVDPAQDLPVEIRPPRPPAHQPVDFKKDWPDKDEWSKPPRWSPDPPKRTMGEKAWEPQRPVTSPLRKTPDPLPKLAEPPRKPDDALPKAEDALPKAGDDPLPKAEDIVAKADEALDTSDDAQDKADDTTSKAEASPARVRRKIWDLEPGAEDAAETAETGDTEETETALAPETAAPAPSGPPMLEVPDLGLSASAPAAPAPAAGGRVKTRLLGFHTGDDALDAFSAEKAPAAAESIKCPVGWIVIVDGPGRGTSFALAPGLSTLGRGADQTIPLDFGDDSISRNNHASIAYDEEENKVLIGHGGKSNLVRLNSKPLVSSEELSSGDQIRVGKTTLRFVALCGADFSWSTDAKETSDDD